MIDISESSLQAQCFKWFNNTYCLINSNPRLVWISIPNGGTRNKIEAMQLRATGTLKGASDVIILLPNKIVFVEFKTEKGVQSEAQKIFQNNVTRLGFEYHIVRNVEQFKYLINQFLLNL